MNEGLSDSASAHEPGAATPSTSNSTEPAPRRSGRARRVVLVSLDWIRDKDPRVSLGHASLLARLRSTPGVEVVSVRHPVNRPGFSDERLANEVLAAALGGEDTMVAIGAYVWNEAHVGRLLRTLRARGFAGDIVIGGPQVSYALAGVASRYPEATHLIRGYGEDALAALATSSGDATIDGVVRQGRADTGCVAAFSFESSVSPILTGAVPMHPFMRWETQRGCRYACSFCQHREAGSRPARATFPLPRIVAEIEAMVAGGVTDIAVLDPIFTQNPDATEILRVFRDRGFGGRLSLQCRFEELTDEFLDACRGLDVRLEFGLQTTARAEMEAVRRPNNLARVARWMGQLQQRGIAYEISLIYALPLQTLASFRASVEWCKGNGTEVIRAFPLMLLRGTEVDLERDRYGLVESDEPIPVVVATSTATRDDVEEMRRLAEALNADAPAAARASEATA